MTMITKEQAQAGLNATECNVVSCPYCGLLRTVIALHERVQELEVALESIAMFDPGVLDVKGQLIAAQDIARAAIKGDTP